MTIAEQRKKAFLARRKRMFVFGLIGLVILGFWTLSAFFDHIKALGGDFTTAAYVGAIYGEVTLFGLLWEYCFDKSLKVRREACIYFFLLTAILAGHAGILRGQHSIEQRQDETEKRLKSGLAEMSKDQMTAVAGAGDGELNPRTRRAANAAAAEARAKIAAGAQEKYAEEIKGRDEKIMGQVLAPKSYINGWMYALLFLVASAFASRVAWLHIHVDPQDLDEDYDGVADHIQKTGRFSGMSDQEVKDVLDGKSSLPGEEPKTTGPEPEPEKITPGFAPAAASIQAPKNAGNLAPGLQPDEQPDADKKASPVDPGLQPDGMAILRQTLSDIGFQRGRGEWYRAEDRKTHIRVRLLTRKANDGAEKAKGTARLKRQVLDDAITMERGAFRARLEKLLDKKMVEEPEPQPTV